MSNDGRKVSSEGDSGWVRDGVPHLNSASLPPSTCQSLVLLSTMAAKMRCSPCNIPLPHFLPVSPPRLGKEMNSTEMYQREQTLNINDLCGAEAEATEAYILEEMLSYSLTLN